MRPPNCSPARAGTAPRWPQLLATTSWSTCCAAGRRTGTRERTGRRAAPARAAPVFHRLQPQARRRGSASDRRRAGYDAFGHAHSAPPAASSPHATKATRCRCTSRPTSASACRPTPAATSS
jgi:hypothetical protein